MTSKNGYYSSGTDNSYILDFENAKIQSKFNGYLSKTDAGFLLQDGSGLAQALKSDLYLLQAYFLDI